MSPPKSLYGAARLEILRLKGELDTHKKAVNAIAFSPDNKLLASADDEGLLAVCLGISEWERSTFADCPPLDPGNGHQYMYSPIQSPEAGGEARVEPHRPLPSLCGMRQWRNSEIDGQQKRSKLPNSYRWYPINLI